MMRDHGCSGSRRRDHGCTRTCCYTQDYTVAEDLETIRQRGADRALLQYRPGADSKAR